MATIEALERITEIPSGIFRLLRNRTALLTISHLIPDTVCLSFIRYSLLFPDYQVLLSKTKWQGCLDL